MKFAWIAAAAAAAIALAAWHPAGKSAGVTITSRAPALAPRSARARRRTVWSGDIVVYVAGAVRNAGLYHVSSGARADDALRKAGGFAPEADRAAINLAQRLADGDEVRVLRVDERTPRPLARRSSRSTKRTAQPAPAALNVNSADARTLELLPGIGPALAERIVAFRHVNGDFQSTDELLDVAGMTQRRLDALSPYLTLHDGP
ncbi:MAG: helix-hairpin-helix domain-containing protein [Candidatus Baltobacteraceae bacterium]